MSNTLNKFQERVLECALDYATSRGWHILPASKSKKPLIKEWTKLATTNEKQIVEWWLQYPTANIGVLTGPESGFWVVDTDNREEYNGLQTLSNFFGNEFIFNSKKYIAGKTPTEGIHLLFQWDDDYPVKTASKILPGVDTRGIGGQIIVAPSSRNIDGEWIEYRWNNWDYPISPMQPWCYELIKMVGEHTTKKLDLNNIAKGLKEGERDEQLNKLAWWFKGHGMSYELAVGFVLAAAEKCIPPFDPDIAKDKVDRAYTTVIEPKLTLDGLKQRMRNMQSGQK